jgi:hypothetical protein
LLRRAVDGRDCLLVVQDEFTMKNQGRIVKCWVPAL